MAPAKLPSTPAWQVGLAIAAASLLVVVGVVAWYLQLPPRPSPAPDKEPAATTVPNPVIGTAFALADRDGDGREDLIISTCTASKDRAAFCAYRAGDHDLAWQVGDMPRTAATHAARAAVMGHHALLVDHAANVFLVALDPGTVAHRTSLDERVAELCVAAEHPGKAWLRLADGRSLWLDTSARTSTATERPRSCPSTELGTVPLCMSMRASERDAECAHTPLPEPIAGMLPFSVTYDGAVGALSGAHTPGSGYPMVAVFDVGASAPRFVRPLADGSPLADGETSAPDAMALAGKRLFVARQATLAAMDATSGKTLWRIDVPAFHQLRASKTRVYLGRWSAVTILDAANGRALATIGR